MRWRTSFVRRVRGIPWRSARFLNLSLARFDVNVPTLPFPVLRKWSFHIELTLVSSGIGIVVNSQSWPNFPIPQSFPLRFQAISLLDYATSQEFGSVQRFVSSIVVNFTDFFTTPNAID